MKTSNLIVILCLLLACPLAAETAQQTDDPKLSPSEVETLVGPIALYPDALIGIILPSSASSTDIVLAARYLEKGGAIDQAATQPWDESVRSLAYYPEVLKWMDENLEWTQQLGVTFLAQPEEVMAAIQRLRARAHALGNLPSTEQLTVVKEATYIRIVPTAPETIYVPYYDPDVIFVSRFYWGFGPAWICGPWLSFDCNWISSSIWIGAWQPRYFYNPPWVRVVRRPPSPQYVDRHTWRPDPRRIATNPRPPSPRPGNIVRPRPIADVNFNRPGQPPPANRPAQRPENLTERRSSGKNTTTRQPPASRPGQSQTQLNSIDTQTPSPTVRPAQRPSRDVQKSRVSTPATQPPANNARVTQRPAAPSSAPTPRQAAQQATATTRVTPPSEPPRQSTSTRDSSESKRSSSSNNTSTSNDTSTSNSSNSSNNTSNSSSSSNNTRSSESRSSYQERSSRSSSSSSDSRSASPPAPRESRTTRPGAR